MVGMCEGDFMDSKENKVSVPVIHYLHTIVVSHYWGKKEWQAWADDLIVCNEELDSWIYDVSMAKDVEALGITIAYERYEEMCDEETDYWEAQVVMGYYYMMYKEGRMRLTELLLKYTDEDDIASKSELLNYEECLLWLEKETLAESDIQKIDKILSPVEQIARKQLYELQHYLK